MTAMTSAAMAMVRVFMVDFFPFGDRFKQRAGRAAMSMPSSPMVGLTDLGTAVAGLTGHRRRAEAGPRSSVLVDGPPRCALPRARRPIRPTFGRMTSTAPLDDDQLTVSRVEGSTVVHLASGSRTLCDGVVFPGRPERLFVQSPCGLCLREADDQGIRTVRDRTSAWVNLGRLSATLRAAALEAA